MKRISFPRVAAMLAATTLVITPAAFAGRIGKRAENQQDRIAQGVNSGQLTARETARIETKETKLHREVANLRSANGGTLTAGERARVNRQQNRLSRDIYFQKHDRQTQKP